MNHPNRTLVLPGFLHEEISTVSGTRQTDRPSLLHLNYVIDNVLREVPQHIDLDLNGNYNDLTLEAGLNTISPTSAAG